jgi:hypothetical protein
LSNSPNLFAIATEENPVLLIDPALENHTAGLCDLLLLIDQSSFQLALSERKTSRLLALEVFKSHGEKDIAHAFLKAATTESQLLKRFEFSKVKAGIITPAFTLVPDALFKPGDQQLYYELNFSNRDALEIKSSHVESQHLQIIFGIPAGLEKELNHLFQDPAILPHVQGILEAVSSQNKSDEEKQVFVNIRAGAIDVLVTEGRQPLLLNSYLCQTPEDILYYVLFVSEQLGLNPDSIQYILSGHTDYNSKTHLLLNTYIRNLTITAPPSGMQSGPIFEKLSLHHYYNLFTLALCE